MSWGMREYDCIVFSSFLERKQQIFKLDVTYLLDILCSPLFSLLLPPPEV